MSTEPAPSFTERARRAQIVAAAVATVNELGYPRTSLAEIAQRAGVAKSAIVYYFGTKDALLLQVVADVFTRLAEDVEGAVAGHDRPVPRLLAYAEAYVAHADVHRADVAAGVEIVVSHRNAEGMPLYLTGTEEDSALLRQILADGMEQGAFRPMPIGVAVDLVEALLDVPVTALQRDLDADLRTLAPEVVTGVLAALRVDAPKR